MRTKEVQTITFASEQMPRPPSGANRRSILSEEETLFGQSHANEAGIIQRYQQRQNRPQQLFYGQLDCLAIYVPERALCAVLLVKLVDRELDQLGNCPAQGERAATATFSRRPPGRNSCRYKSLRPSGHWSFDEYP